MSAATELEGLLQFFYQCPVGLLEITDAGAVEKINPAAARMLASALDGDDLQELFPLLHRLAPQIVAAISGTMLTPGTSRKAKASARAWSRNRGI